MIPMRSATTSRSAAFAPSSRQDRTAPTRSATTSGFTVSATASSGCSAISRSTAPSPHDMINSPIASPECYISQPRVTGSNLSTRPRRSTGYRLANDLACVVIDTTVQPKAVMFPTDAKLINRARERLVRLAKKLGVSLRQSYARVGKLALIKHQRYAHAHQFKCANRSLRKLKTYLGRVIRDIERRLIS